MNAINQAAREIGLPKTAETSFQGTAQAFQSSLKTQPIAAAIFAVYAVLGILYESFIHPFAILMSLTSATVGALLCLEIFGFDLSVIAMIRLIMLIGIVKKNAIMMIDFALERVRHEHKSPDEAIYEAALLRFRPIIMMTMAAIFGILPIAIGIGAGSELRQPLGVAVVGGLVVSQALTLFTTPFTYVYNGTAEGMDRSLRPLAATRAGSGARPCAYPRRQLSPARSSLQECCRITRPLKPRNRVVIFRIDRAAPERK